MRLYYLKSRGDLWSSNKFFAGAQLNIPMQRSLLEMSGACRIDKMTSLKLKSRNIVLLYNDITRFFLSTHSGRTLNRGSTGLLAGSLD